MQKNSTDTTPPPCLPLQIKPILLYQEIGDNVGKIEYIQHMGSDITVVNAARVSFGTEKKELNDKDHKLIKYLLAHKHTSTLEHNVITFRFTVPLFIRSQHHRHRTWSYNEISRRYTSIDLKFYEPNSFRLQHSSNRQASKLESAFNPTIPIADDAHPHLEFPVDATSAIAEHHHDSLSLFNKLLDAGVCREQARGVLPQNLYTQYYGTVNLNNLIKFIKLRVHEGAQWEIQQVAIACLNIATQIWPTVFSKINFFQ